MINYNTKQTFNINALEAINDALALKVKECIHDHDHDPEA